MKTCKAISPAIAAAHSVPILALPPHELVTNDTLRRYARIDHQTISDGDDEKLFAELVMALADICGELLARRHAMAKGLA
jgi:hypothetical protein